MIAATPTCHVMQITTKIFPHLLASHPGIPQVWKAQGVCTRCPQASWARVPRGGGRGGSDRVGLDP